MKLTISPARAKLRKPKRTTNKIRLEDWTERHFIRYFGHVVTPEYKEFLARYFWKRFGARAETMVLGECWPNELKRELKRLRLI